MKTSLAIIGTVALLGLSQPAAAFNIGSIGGAAQDAVDVAQTMSIGDKEEMEIGAQIHPKILSEYGGETSSTALKKYVESVGQKLVKVSDRKGITYHFTVLNSDVVNAFAVPGGYVYVTKGILRLMSDESELAAVLGHEIVHVSHKHGIKQLQKATLASKAGGYGVGAATGAMGGGAGGILAGEALNQATSLFLTFAIKGYGRENELDSDRTGLKFASTAGYDPKGAERLFTHLLSLEKGAKPKGFDALLASHPNTDKRLKLAQEEIAKLPTPTGTATNEAGYKKATKGV